MSRDDPARRFPVGTASGEWRRTGETRATAALKQQRQPQHIAMELHGAVDVVDDIGDLRDFRHDPAAIVAP